MPSPEPPHGHDCEAVREWAATHATEEEFAQLYQQRARRVLRRHYDRARRVQAGTLIDDLPPLRPTEKHDHPFFIRIRNLTEK